MHTIYKITNTITNQVYIGQATNVTKRFEDYRRRLTRGQPKLNESFLTYGTINHKFEIICTCLDTIADKLEIYFINHYKSYFYKYRNRGLNLTRGGRRGSAQPEETKAKIAKSLTGKKQSQDTIDKKKAKNSKALIVLGESLVQTPYPSLALASRELEIAESTIRNKLVTLANVDQLQKQDVYYIRSGDLDAVLPKLQAKLAQ